MREARSVADVSTGTVHAMVEIAAPPERVFRALASEEIVKWWGSADLYRCTKWTGDVRKGGRWRTDGMGADGKAFSVEGDAGGGAAVHPRVVLDGPPRRLEEAVDLGAGLLLRRHRGGGGWEVAGRRS